MDLKKLERSHIYSLWQFHSGQMWSRIQTATAIEVGVITGWYITRCQMIEISYVVLFGGSFLLIITGLLMRRDAQYMVACEKLLKSAFPKPDKPFLGLSGRILAVLILFLLALSNILLAVYQSKTNIGCV